METVVRGTLNPKYKQWDNQGWLFTAIFPSSENILQKILNNRFD